MIIATLDVPTLKNVKVAIETLDLLNIAVDHRHLVLNRADDAVGLDDAKVEQILSMPVSVPIPTSIDIAAATNSGTPIVLSQPNHPASRAFQAAGHVAVHRARRLPPDRAPPSPSSDGQRQRRDVVSG